MTLARRTRATSRAARPGGDDTNPIGQTTAVRVAIRRLDGNDDLPVPEPATAASAGVDLRAAVLAPLELAPGERALVPTGFAIALPDGHEGQVRPRSGLALKLGVTLLNSPGTIDSDYRGEIAVVMVNLGQSKVAIRRGDRIAQLVVAPVTRPAFDLVAELPATGRGAGGFGHTGDR
jgi:dUTP pyrophosphatase